MATVWRLTPPDYSYSLDGEGSRLIGGRWNSPGWAMLYTASHLSLNILEVFVHFPDARRDELPEMVAVHIEVPDDAGASEIDIPQFQSLMAAPDPLAACQALGDEWLAKGGKLVLRAPSVLVPEETNVMLNPQHPAMSGVRIISS